MRTAFLAVLVTVVGAPVHALQWETLPALPEPVAGPVCGALGDAVVCLGGTRGSAGESTLSSAVHVLSPGDVAWQTAGSLPFPLTEAAAASAGERLYVMSGTDGRRALTDSLVCVRWRRSWQWLRGPDLPEPRLQAAAAVIGRTVYLSGGAPGLGLAGKLSNGLLRLNTAAETSAWEALRRMPGGGRAQHATVACGGKLYVFGGVTREGDALVPSDDAFRYDPAHNRWERLPDMPRAVRQAVAVEHGGHVLVIGGRQLPPATTGIAEYVSSQVLDFDPATKTYLDAGELPSAVAGLGTARLTRGDVVMVGGETPAGGPAAEAFVLRAP